MSMRYHTYFSYHLTPNANAFAPGQDLRPISCFYAMNTPYISNDTYSLTTNAIYYDKAAKGLKQKFSFNCNENFTFFLNKPQTMETDTPVIFKPGTWWSLGELKATDRNLDKSLAPPPTTPPSGNQTKGRRDGMDEEEYEDDEDEYGSIAADKVEMNCGRLFFWSEGDNGSIPYTLTVSYKIALKG